MTGTKLTRDSFHVFQANARNALRQSRQVPSVLICAGTGCIAGRRHEDLRKYQGRVRKAGPPRIRGIEA